MKNKKIHHTVRIVLKSNHKIDTPNTYTHARPLSWLGTGRAKLNIYAKTSHLSENWKKKESLTVKPQNN
jgi:hypothetical protein